MEEGRDVNEDVAWELRPTRTGRRLPVGPIWVELHPSQEVRYHLSIVPALSSHERVLTTESVSHRESVESRVVDVKPRVLGGSRFDSIVPDLLRSADWSNGGTATNDVNRWLASLSVVHGRKNRWGETHRSRQIGQRIYRSQVRETHAWQHEPKEDSISPQRPILHSNALLLTET